MRLLLLIVVFEIHVCSGEFSPPTSDYDAYGLKIAGNDIMLVEALADISIFLVQFGPYNYTLHPLHCPIKYNDSTHYVYSVGIGAKQNSIQAHFFYAGEVTSNNSSATDSSDKNGTFIGILSNTDPRNAQTYADTEKLFNCDYFEYQPLQFISSYGHQEFFVFGVEPYGQYAIGLAKDFVFIYEPFSSNSITTKDSRLVWPTNTTFLPVAAKTDISYTIVAGFVVNNPNSRVRATPTVYVISNSDLTVRATWSYTAALNSWQFRWTYTSLKDWSNKYIMSVDINPDDTTRVLVGMPFLNTVFLLIISKDSSSITLASSLDNGDSVGFGKSVAWLPNSQVAILVSNYPSDDSSKIYLYTSLNNTTLPSSPTVVFPNIQQALPTTISAHLIRFISTPTALAILNVDSDVLFILPAPPGFFASTVVSVTDSIFIVSQPNVCMAGTYKVGTSIHPCSLCPSGSRNPGNLIATSCINCSSNAFCPTGAVVETNATYLLPRSQAYAYPRSPESTIFDEILLQNMFSIGSSGHCILVSPLLWVIIVIGIALAIVISMAILKWYVRHPKGKQWHRTAKKIFRQADLIGEGEMSTGGLVSFAIVVLFIFAYTFSAAFYRQYPSENVGPSTFACDETIRNSKYESGLQSLSIPVSKEEQPMLDLLNKQHFTLRLDLLNTVASCKGLSVQQILGSSTAKLISTCTDSVGILSAAAELPYQKVIIKWVLDDIALVGAVRISLSANEKGSDSYKLKELDFSQTFYDDSNRTLAQAMAINLQLTKAINETEPLTGHTSEFTGIWYPTFVIDENHMFISAEQYATSANLTSTTLTIVTSETSYYIKNRQLPIAKQREIIFHNLLFTVVCLEIFGLVFLIVKLTIIPLLYLIVRHFLKKNDILLRTKKSVDRDTITDDHETTTDDHGTITKDHNVAEENC